MEQESKTTQVHSVAQQRAKFTLIGRDLRKISEHFKQQTKLHHPSERILIKFYPCQQSFVLYPGRLVFLILELLLFRH